MRVCRCVHACMTRTREFPHILVPKPASKDWDTKRSNHSFPTKNLSPNPLPLSAPLNLHNIWTPTKHIRRTLGCNTSNLTACHCCMSRAARSVLGLRALASALARRSSAEAFPTSPWRNATTPFPMDDRRMVIAKQEHSGGPGSGGAKKRVSGSDWHGSGDSAKTRALTTRISSG